MVSNSPMMSLPLSLLWSTLFRMYLSLLLLAQVCPLSLILTAPLRSHSTLFKRTLKSGELSESNVTFTSTGWKASALILYKVRATTRAQLVIAAIFKRQSSCSSRPAPPPDFYAHAHLPTLELSTRNFPGPDSVQWIDLLLEARGMVKFPILFLPGNPEEESTIGRYQSFN